MDIIRRARLSEMDESTFEFLQSQDADRWIFRADIEVDKAHTRMLLEKGIISEKEASLILEGLEKIEKDGVDALNLERYEDVHAAIESRLIELIGEEVGGRMHTGRSRNDEVATCIRLALRGELGALREELESLRRTILRQAEQHVETFMPGFTHLQHAQPTTLAHHLLAHFDALGRDLERLEAVYHRTNKSPLGAAALASTSFPIDRNRTMELLGFEGIIENSMDAVSARDFLIEAIAVSSILMMHLSRIAEELILWSTQEFNFVELDDAVTSTSSIMPQKKNPDLAELIRAKTGTVFGALIATLAIGKGLPMSYNRDLQEMTPHLLRAITIARASVRGMERMIRGMRVKDGSMRSMLDLGDITATDLADTLVRVTKIPFRTAHQIVGRAVSEGEKITLELIDRISAEIIGRPLSSMGLDESALKDALDPVESVKKRSVTGGPAPDEVRKMIASRRRDDYQTSLPP
ncbi:MAG: argininosuccinate lyase [Candidatus Syntrophoarchaeum sp. WYZ-LMO15]|nr:MAG: argininosuccinate lyase [Candidatus Syntrophoarchaeum sp. WYZ-LMO15]